MPAKRIGRIEARLQGRRATRVLQPYYDLAKLFTKESLAPECASWVFLATPLIAFSAYLTLPLLIPVLTNYPLPLGYMGDILGGGLILALASFFTATAAAETGSPYAQLGASRAKTFSALAEPTLLLVFVAVATITATDLPYALAKTIHGSAAQIVRPGHLLAAAALFCVILAETGRIPVEAHHSTGELGFIDEGKPFEHSGPYYALLTWGAHIKPLVLFIILLDVFTVPWGLAGSRRLESLLLAVVILLGKCAGLRCRHRRHRRHLSEAAPVQDHRVPCGSVSARGSGHLHPVPLEVADAAGPGRFRRRVEHHRSAGAAHRVRHAAARFAARAAASVHSAVAAVVGAGRRRRCKPRPSGPLHPGRVVLRVEGRHRAAGGEPAAA
jgi:formate hydrogenlyase subunit 4